MAELLEHMEQNPGFVHYLQQVPLDDSMDDLLDDAKTVEVFDASRARSIDLWYSQRGSRLPLHWDRSDNIFAQARGTKEVVCYSPEQSEFLYPGRGDAQFASQIDLDAPDLERFPEFRNAVPSGPLQVNAGDLLLIPKRWWHRINTISDRSVTLTYWL